MAYWDWERLREAELILLNTDIWKTNYKKFFQEKNKNKFDVISAEERRENDSMSMKGMWEKKKEEGPKNTVFSS